MQLIARMVDQFHNWGQVIWKILLLVDTITFWLRSRLCLTKSAKVQCLTIMLEVLAVRRALSGTRDLWLLQSVEYVQVQCRSIKRQLLASKHKAHYLTIKASLFYSFTSKWGSKTHMKQRFSPSEKLLRPSCNLSQPR